MKTLLLKNRIALVAVACFAFQIVPSHAAITVVSYWRLGEGDPGAVVGGTVTNGTDSAGANNLSFQGNAHYANDVAIAAASHAASSLSVNFPNGAYATRPIVSTASDNFGVECWVKPKPHSGEARSLFTMAERGVPPAVPVGELSLPRTTLTRACSVVSLRLEPI